LDWIIIIIIKTITYIYMFIELDADSEKCKKRKQFKTPNQFRASEDTHDLGFIMCATPLSHHIQNRFCKQNNFTGLPVKKKNWHW